MDVEYYRKLILETLYKGFMKNPPNRIKNADADSAFGKINDISNFRIAREQLIQEGLIYGKNVDFGNPKHFRITGNGLIHYEENFIFPSVKREYILLASKILIFFRDLGDNKYDLRKYVKDIDERHKQANIPLDDIKEVMKINYNYDMNDKKWLLLYFTSTFINNHIMGTGFGKTNEFLRFNNPDAICLNTNGWKFLKDVFLKEKFQKIKNDDGRNRVIQLYNDLNVLISRERWVDVAIIMGVIIEYCIDNYVEKKSLKNYFKKADTFNLKLKIILQNQEKTKPDLIFETQYRPTWNRIKNVIKEWRNYVHISKLVKEQSPLDKHSIQKFYGDFESALNILLNL